MPLVQRLPSHKAYFVINGPDALSDWRGRVFELVDIRIFFMKVTWLYYHLGLVLAFVIWEWEFGTSMTDLCWRLLVGLQIM